MAGKVASEAKVTPKKKTEEPVTLEPRAATPEELAKQAANDAVQATFREFMPMFQQLLANQNAPAAPVKQEMNSVQARVMQTINRNFDKRVAHNNEFVKILANSPRKDYVVMSIPRVFAKYFGSQLPVGLNGSVIQVPVNGRPFRVHKLYVPIIKQALEYKDQKIAFMESTNFEDIAEVPDVGSLGRM